MTCNVYYHIIKIHITKGDNMRRTYTDQNQREKDFLAQIGDRDMTVEEAKQLQIIRRNARQNQWRDKKSDRIDVSFPKGYKSKVTAMTEQMDITMSTFFCQAIDTAWKSSAPYQAIMELYNYLNLTSDTINEDLASERLKLTKHNNQSAWIYNDGEIIGGIYANNTWIINKDEIKASE